MILSYLLDGFKEEIEKIALTRYAVEEHSDGAGDTQFLHRKAGSQTYESPTEYIPPSKRGKKDRKKMKYKYMESPSQLVSNERVSVNGLNDDQGVNDYQTARAMLPEVPNVDFK